MDQEEEKDRKTDEQKAGKAFSLRNILVGMLLGFAIVAGWLYYPEISAYFSSSAPEIIEETKEVVREKLEAVKGTSSTEKKKSSMNDEPAGSDEKGHVSGTKIAEPGGEIHASLDDGAKGQGPDESGDKRKIESYYSGEEALWQALLKRKINPEYIGGYPYARCFKSAAEENNISIALVLGLAGSLSNFDPESTLDGRSGIMHLDASGKKGIEKEEAPTEPCQDISVGTRYLAGLLSKSGGTMVPALIAYRGQLESVYPESIKKEDLAFSSKLRESVEEVLSGPFKRITLYPFRTFDTLITAKNFIKSIKGSSDVELRLVQKEYRYVVSIPAVDEVERNEKANRIKEESGIEGE